jgi:DNA invertase Pin-like site-specific DNA recombinase
MALIGYARVSKDEQNLDLQLDALKKAGCVRIFTDKLTGTRFDRKALTQALDYLNEGDSLVVWRLDRLGRSMVDLVNTIMGVSKRHIHFVSLTEHIDTTTAVGKMFLQFLAMLAEFERNLISERTRAGLEAARARGRKGGRRPLSLTSGKPALALKLYDEKSMEISDICKTLHISRATLFRWAKQRKEQWASGFAHEGQAPPQWN